MRVAVTGRRWIHPCPAPASRNWPQPTARLHPARRPSTSSLAPAANSLPHATTVPRAGRRLSLVRRRRSPLPLRAASPSALAPDSHAAALRPTSRVTSSVTTPELHRPDPELDRLLDRVDEGDPPGGCCSSASTG